MLVTNCCCLHAIGSMSSLLQLILLCLGTMKQYQHDNLEEGGAVNCVLPYLSMECCQFIVKQIREKSVSKM